MDAGLFAGLARALLARQVDGGVEAELGAQQLANLAWAFSHAGPLPDGLGERLFASLGAAAAAVAAQFSAAELASVAWAFANAGHLDAGLFRALGAAASSRLRDFTDEELDNAEWAFSRAGQGSLAAALRRGRRRKANVTEPAASALATGGSGGKGAEGPGACGTIVVAGGGIGGAAAAVALQVRGLPMYSECVRYCHPRAGECPRGAVGGASAWRIWTMLSQLIGHLHTTPSARQGTNGSSATYEYEPCLVTYYASTSQDDVNL